MLLRSLALAALLTTLPSLVSAQEPAKYLLRYKFQPGATLRFRETNRSEYDITVSGTNEQPYSDQVSTKSLIVVSVDSAGAAVVHTRFDSLESLTTFSEGRKYEWTQEPAKDEPLVFASMRDTLGKERMELTLSPIGVVSNPRPLTEAIVKEQTDDLKNKKAAAERVLEILPRLTEEPVAVGGSWKDQYEVLILAPGSKVLPQSIKMQRRYTLASVANGQATINYITSILTPITDVEQEMQLVQRCPRGAFIVDIDRGLLLSHRVSQEKTVNGFSGASSLFKFKQERTEMLLTGQAAVIPVSR